jgi:hypothetical protein
MKTTKKIRKKSNANMVERLHGLFNMLKITLNKKKQGHDGLRRKSCGNGGCNVLIWNLGQRWKGMDK